MTVSEESHKCPSCSNMLTGLYCSHCGERRLTSEMRSMSHIAGELFQEFTSIDGKLFRTLKLFLINPGQYDKDYHQGCRVNYFKPITLFLLINIAFVFLSPITDFYVSFLDQITLQQYSSWIRPWIESYVAGLGVSMKEFGLLYDQLVTVLARSLVIVQVPFFALFMWIIFMRKGFYAGDYFIFSLNAHSWLMLWIVLAQIPTLLIYGVLSIWSEPDAFEIYLLLLPIGFVTYLFFAAKKLFDLAVWQVIWRLVFALLAYQVSHVLFRFCQLIITLSLVEVN